MKIEYTTGCTDAVEIDGTEFIYLSYKDQMDVCKKLLETQKLPESLLRNFVSDTAEWIGEEEYLDYCEECGAYNSKYKIEI